MQDLMGSSDLSKEQKQLLKTSLLCQEQLTKIIDDTDIESIEECYMEMKSGEFNLAEALEAVMTQVMIPSKEHQVQLIRDLPDEVSSMNLYGDKLRLQQVLSDLLTNALIFTPAYEGSSIAFRVIPRNQRIEKKIHIVHLEFRITHPAPGIPEKLIHEMFYHSQGASREGLGLYMCQKLVKINEWHLARRHLFLHEKSPPPILRRGRRKKDSVDGEKLSLEEASVASFGKQKAYFLNCHNTQRRRNPIRSINSTPPLHSNFDVLEHLVSIYRDSRYLKDAKLGFHLRTLKLGFHYDTFLCNTLVNVYVRAGDLVSANKLFDEMPDRNSYSWAALISGYIQNGMFSV
ncbi:hypothetical protein LWI28_022050 [Acer negundo]|uniref:histidine kinase n=1 Tax=Acer negundo TaxID=4023 RepID=A0AAD5NSR7_ACENE|nr:hypothetical protein LWI28_022050 [Acer negundo]